MKKNAFVLTTLLVIMNYVFANSVKIKIINNSNTAFIKTNHVANMGKYCVKDYPNYTNTIAPGSFGEFYSTESCGATGVDGFVEYSATKEGKTYQLYIGFNNPFVGSNEYDPKISYPFIIKHISGGGGSDVFITYEINGGPSPVPPPVPVLINATGNRIISGSFIWNENIEGMPELNGLDLANNTFGIIAKAPSILVRNTEGTGSNIYNGQRGNFSNLRTVGSISFRIIENSFANKKNIQYTISNLPENVPITIGSEAITDWQPGEASPPKPENQTTSQYIIILDEANKSINSVNYKITGGWLVNVGNGKSGGATSDMQALLNKAKGKIFKPGEDITMGDVFNKGNFNQNGNNKTLVNKGTLLGNNNATQVKIVPGTNTNNQIKTPSPLKTNTPVQQKNIQQKAAIKSGGK